MMAMICGRGGHSGSARKEAPSGSANGFRERMREEGSEEGGMQKRLFYEEASLRSERRKRGLIIQISGSARTDERTNARWGEPLEK